MSDYERHNAGEGPPSHEQAPGWERETLERLAFAHLKEQRAARRWRNAIRLLWLGVVVTILWLSFSRGTGTTHVNQAHTAVVQIQGEIASDADASADWIVSALRDAFQDEGSQAVVLLINSPGGSPVQAGIINDE
ncbi:MAG: S49 family peptidase, partial [Limnohabitans sp.]